MQQALYKVSHSWCVDTKLNIDSPM